MITEHDFIGMISESRGKCASFDCPSCRLGVPVEVDRFEFPSGRKRTFRYFKCGGLNEVWKYLDMVEGESDG